MQQLENHDRFASESLTLRMRKFPSSDLEQRSTAPLPRFCVLRFYAAQLSDQLERTAAEEEIAIDDHSEGHHCSHWWPLLRLAPNSMTGGVANCLPAGAACRTPSYAGVGSALAPCALAAEAPPSAAAPAAAATAAPAAAPPGEASSFHGSRRQAIASVCVALLPAPCTAHPSHDRGLAAGAAKQNSV